MTEIDELWLNDEQDDLSIGVAVGLGSSHETPETAGIAHLAEHLLGAVMKGALSAIVDDVFYLSARTYSMHTEFAVWFPDGTAAPAAVETCMRNVLTLRLGYSSEDINRELKVIGREIDYRRSSSCDGILPWSFAPSIYAPERPSQNTFDVSYARAEVLEQQLEAWLQRLARCPMSWCVAPSGTAGVTERSVLPGEAVTQPPEPSPLPARRGYGEFVSGRKNPTVGHMVNGLRGVRVLEAYQCASGAVHSSTGTRDEMALTEYLARVVLAEVLEQMQPTRKVFVGLFGPWGSADDGHIYAYSCDSHGRPLWEETFQIDDVDGAITRLSEKLIQVIESPLDHVAFRARTHLFGLPDALALLERLRSVSFAHVRVAADRLAEAKIVRHEFHGEGQ